MRRGCNPPFHSPRLQVTVTRGSKRASNPEDGSPLQGRPNAFCGAATPPAVTFALGEPGFFAPDEAKACETRSRSRRLHGSKRNSAEKRIMHHYQVPPVFILSSSPNMQVCIVSRRELLRSETRFLLITLFYFWLGYSPTRHRHFVINARSSEVTVPEHIPGVLVLHLYSHYFVTLVNNHPSRTAPGYLDGNTQLTHQWSCS